MAERDIRSLEDKLQPYPHYLQLGVIMRVKSEDCRSILDKLLSERTEEYENMCNKNFTTLLYIRLGKYKEASTLNKDLREGDPTNITALVNRVFLETLIGCIQKADAALAELTTLKQRKYFADYRAVALAEQAYSLGRIFPLYYEKAVELYQEAINRVPMQYHWKFGCAQTSRRSIGAPKSYLHFPDHKLKYFCRTAFEYLSEVIENCDNTHLRASAWVELGVLCIRFENPSLPLTTDLINELHLNNPYTAEECFDKALDTDPGNRYVLERCGRFLQFVRPYRKEALQEYHWYLNEAYKMNPTSFSCAHLATVLIKMALRNVEPTNTNPFTNRNKQVPLGSQRYHQGEKRGSTSNVVGGENNPEVTRSEPRNGADSVSLRSQIENLQIQPRPRHSGKMVPRVRRDDIRVKRAFFILEKAVEIKEGTDNTAIAKLGRLYRQVGDDPAAIKQFRRITTGNRFSAYDKAEAYEMQGYCLLNMSENSWRQEEQDRFKKDSELMMLMSVEQTAILALETASGGNGKFLTLSQLLSTETHSSEIAKSFAKLLSRIEEHNVRETLDYGKQSLQSDPNDFRALAEIIESYVGRLEFHNAQVCLRLFLCTREGNEMNSLMPNLEYQVFLGTIRNMLFSGKSLTDTDLFRASCRSVFDKKYGRSNGEVDQLFDVFIVNDTDQSNTEAAALETWLKDTCCLAVTRNNDETPGCSLYVSAEIGFLSSCSCLVIVLGPDDTETQRELISLVTLITAKDSRPVVVPVLSCERDLPAAMLPLRHVVLQGDSPPPATLLKVFMALLDLDDASFDWIESAL